jgi:hypothetical protein
MLPQVMVRAGARGRAGDLTRIAAIGFRHDDAAMRIST